MFYGLKANLHPILMDLSWHPSMVLYTIHGFKWFKYNLLMLNMVLYTLLIYLTVLSEGGAQGWQVRRYSASNQLEGPILPPPLADVSAL